MHAAEYDYLFKLLLIGDSGVGKVSNGLRMPASPSGNPICLLPFVQILRGNSLPEY